jgi:hypothetical protein
MITARIVGVEGVLNLFGQLGPTLEKHTILGLSQATYDGAQAGAGRHTKTGALFQSLYNRPIPTGRAVGHDPQRAPHAVFVNFGTKPHDIRPKTKKSLRWPSGGKFVFARAVKHPGTAADPYMFRSADEAIAKMGAIVDAALRKADNR